MLSLTETLSSTGYGCFSHRDDAEALAHMIKAHLDLGGAGFDMPVLVTTDDGRTLKSARIVRNTLTDGSHTIDLVLSFNPA